MSLKSKTAKEVQVLETVYTVEKLCEMLSITENTVRKYASQGKIPHYKKFGRLYFLYSEIIDLIKN